MNFQSFSKAARRRMTVAIADSSMLGKNKMKVPPKRDRSQSRWELWCLYIHCFFKIEQYMSQYTPPYLTPTWFLEFGHGGEYCMMIRQNQMGETTHPSKRWQTETKINHYSWLKMSLPKTLCLIIKWTKTRNSYYTGWKPSCIGQCITNFLLLFFLSKIQWDFVLF